MHINELVKAASSQMQTDFEVSRKKFGSPVDIGADRVNILSDFLIKYLPRHYGFGNGEIIDSADNRSGQVDIIICNQYHPFTYSKEGLGLFLAEGVDWAIEVKSNLASELEQGLLQVKKVKQLRKKPQKGDLMRSGGTILHRNQIPCLLFGYQSPSISNLRVNIKRLASKLQLSQEEMPDAVITLGKGIVYNVFQGDPLVIKIDDVTKCGIIGAELKEETLFQMLIFLSHHAPQVVFQNPIILNYATPVPARFYYD